MEFDTNPWSVETLDTYLYYCCPECDHKCKSKPSFVHHAYSCHPNAKDNLKYEETMEEIVVKSDMSIKEEAAEPDNEVYEDFDQINHENLDWYDPDLLYGSFEEPPKKKRGRPPKHKPEGKH